VTIPSYTHLHSVFYLEFGLGSLASSISWRLQMLLLLKEVSTSPSRRDKKGLCTNRAQHRFAWILYTCSWEDVFCKPPFKTHRGGKRV
jgi:hypothetical protein